MLKFLTLDTGNVYKTIHSFPFEGVSMKFFEFKYDKNGNWTEKNILIRRPVEFTKEHIKTW